MMTYRGGYSADDIDELLLLFTDGLTEARIPAAATLLGRLSNGVDDDTRCWLLVSSTLLMTYALRPMPRGIGRRGSVAPGQMPPAALLRNVLAVRNHPQKRST